MPDTADFIVSSDLSRIGFKNGKSKTDIGVSQVERATSVGEPEKDHINYDRVDKEIAKYVSATRIDISEADSKRLKRMIDKRVLTVMVFTYFLQALDKGTMSFASIMHIRQDLNLHGQQVGPSLLASLGVVQGTRSLTQISTPGSRRVSTLLSSLLNIRQTG